MSVALKIEMPAGHLKGEALASSYWSINSRSRFARTLTVPLPLSLKSRPIRNGRRSPSNRNALAKRPGLQGPIDDAFMDAFTFVGPEDSENPSTVDKWIEEEFRHAKNEWKRHFRGDVVETHAGDVTDEEIASRNLILFGTPKTNPLIAKIAGQLPIQWQADTIRVGEQVFQGNHVPLLIYPNPLNPRALRRAQ